MKFPRPFFRTSKQAWYLQVGKRQILLSKDRDEALKRYRELMLHEFGYLQPASPALTVAEACDLFLDWCQRHNEPSSYEHYSRYLQDFCKSVGGLRAGELKPFHVTRWLDQHQGWGPSSHRNAIGSVKRVFSWCESEGLLPANPVKRIRKPQGRSRDRILTASERATILAAIHDHAFQNFVLALQETGCRPSEVAGVTGADVRLDEGTWVLIKHKTFRKTGQPRTVYLTPTMLDLTRWLMLKHPDGPLFRNRLGKPWTRNAIRCRFRRLRKKLPQLKGVVSYTYRHSFATDALVNGVGVAEVAELLGHKDLAMIQKHYGHLAEKRDHLRQAVLRATRPLAS